MREQPRPVPSRCIPLGTLPSCFSVPDACDTRSTAAHLPTAPAQVPHSPCRAAGLSPLDSAHAWLRLGWGPFPSASLGAPPARPLSSRRPPAASLAALGAPRGREGSGAGPARPGPFRARSGCRRAGPSEGAAEDGGQAVGPTSGARLFLGSVPPPRAAPFPTLPAASSLLPGEGSGSGCPG